MLYRLSTLAIMAGLVAPATTSAQINGPVGVWTDSERSMTVQIAPCGAVANAFCGRVLQDNRPGPAANPPNHMLIRNLQQDSRGWKGQLNDNGTTLNFTLRLTGPNTAQARFCFWGVCETEIWSRISAGNRVDSPLRQ